MRCTFFVWPFFLPKLNLGVHKYTLAPCPVFGGNFKQILTAIFGPDLKLISLPSFPHQPHGSVQVPNVILEI
jgi:hypothetical protein